MHLLAFAYISFWDMIRSLSKTYLSPPEAISHAVNNSKYLKLHIYTKRSNNFITSSGANLGNNGVLATVIKQFVHVRCFLFAGQVVITSRFDGLLRFNFKWSAVTFVGAKRSFT